MILFRYLSREIFLSTFAVSITLLVIVMSGRLVKYLAEAAAGDLSPDVLMSIMLFRVPSFLELVLPLGLFIGILLGYGRLYVDSEMTVMSACGLSVSRLAAYTLVPACCLAVLVGYISLYLSPAGMAKVNEIFESLEASSGLDSVVSGRFRVDQKTGRVTYVKAFTNDKKLMKEVFTADPHVSDDGRVQHHVILAEQGYIDIPEQYDGRYLVMENGRRYEGQPGEKDYQVTEFSQYGQRLKDKVVAKRRSGRVDALPTEALMDSKHPRERAALQWRVSLAILVPIISLIALALSKTTHRQGRYVKMLPAFLIYIFYVVSLNAARDAIEKGDLPVGWGMWWVHLIFLALALVLLYGGDGWRRLRARKAVKS
ncbi:LPS export ABC transporter permease LptF [Dasania sp. GY-MA-18]|uniref:Lipopolysaccharide export system permease protein LptF n=1 Tax=Dasania phycosphaerae TaxID=2950436 RepID=A0A9J6RMH3_9GAMM|nr:MULTISPECIES: LPS export ABC transporter permease LptF [Dasania]MCR8923291.1 LPS export ABC transporter permease LptF [Dasania sp. GY-MA-18]MCZ0865723.1 LPS export ABC transporter permease LptF [Dasania phycosphaerae]MCZ0869448.1 LPS export ABC transporter permease LptF [Dasania phycosphaerae]